MGSSWTQREARRKGGGGGSTSSGGNNSGSGGGFGKSKASKYSSGVQSRGSGGVGDDDAVVEAATGSSSSSAVLDKWGLPPPTLEDIFPPLEEGTKLIPAQNEKEYSLKEIQQATQSFIPLALDVCFDVDGAEKKKMAVQPREASSTNVPPMKLRLLHVSPPVLTIDHFFTPQECASIKRVATESSSDKNSASAGGGGGPVQVHSKTFAGALSTRTSTSWFCYYRDVPTLLAKACRVLGLRLEAMEEPQIVRYGPGQEFSFHYDEIPASQLANGGQRLATLL
jgi:prolyl 4-hydroxylase